MPQPKALRVAGRKWFIVWLLVALAGCAATLVSLPIILAAIPGIVAFGVDEAIARIVVLSTWTTISFPLLMAGFRLADLVTLWVHVRTQGPRRANPVPTRLNL